MAVQVFFASVSGNLEVKKHQQKIFMTLDSKKIPYTPVDICQDCKEKDLMRKIAGDEKALPPQICNGDVYCGDYGTFESAVEDDSLEKFLKLKAPE